MTHMERIRTVLTAAVTWLVAAGVIITILLEELAPFTGTIPDVVFSILTGVLTVAGVAVAIIRRVTPVLPTARGILPPPAGTPYTAGEAAAGN